MKSRRYPGAAMLAGAIGGLFGGWFKLGWEVLWPPRAAGRIPEPMVLVSTFTHAATPAWASYAIHFAFSTLSGVAFGALVEFVPLVALGAGAAFGIAIWIGAHEVVMPLLGLTPPPWNLPASEQGSEFFGHALWGIVICVFYSFYRPRFRRGAVLQTIGDRRPVALPIPESVAIY